MWRWKQGITGICGLLIASSAAIAGREGDYSVPRGCNQPVQRLAKLDSSRVIMLGEFSVCGTAVAPKLAAYNFASGQFHTVGVGLGADADQLPLYEPSAIVGDGSGRVYLAKADNTSRLQLARTDASNQLEWIVQSGGPSIAGTPIAMDFAPDGSLYIATGRTVLRGNPGSPWTFTRLGSSNLLPSGAIQAIAYDLERAQVVVGGSFSSIGGAGANNIARWTGSAWAALPAVLDGAGVNGPVHTLESVQGGNGGLADGLYLAGEFSSGMAGITQLYNIARYNGSGYNVLGASLSNRGLRGGTVRDIRLNEARTQLLAAGGFHTAGSALVVNGVARWDGATWAGYDDVASGLGLDPGPQAVVEVGGRVAVGGDIDRAGTAPYNHIAHYQGGGWRALGADSGAGLVGRNFFGTRAGQPSRILGGDAVFIGEVTRIGLQNTSNALRWEAASGLPRPVLPSAMDIPDFTIGCADPGDRSVQLFAAGSMPFAEAGITGPHAQLNLTTGALTAGGAHPADRCAVSATSGVVYSAHNNTASSAQIRNYNPATGASSLIGTVTGQVYAMAFDDLNRVLYIAGELSNVAGVGAANAARYDVQSASWDSLGGPAAGFGLNGLVTAIGIDLARGDYVYFGGRFSSAGGFAQPSIARWNVVSESWVPMASFCSVINEACPSLLVEIERLLPNSAEGVIVAGDFATLDGGRSLVAFDGSAWSDRFDGGVFNTRGESGDVRELHLVDDQLVVTGQFIGRGRGSDSAAASGLAVFEIASGPLPDPIFADGFD